MNKRDFTRVTQPLKKVGSFFYPKNKKTLPLIIEGTNMPLLLTEYILLMTSLPHSLGVEPCPQDPGWVNTGYSCYLISHTSMSWFEAEDFCYQKEGYLAEIQSQTEDTLLDTILPEDIHYWIGLSYLSAEGEGLDEQSSTCKIHKLGTKTTTRRRVLCVQVFQAL